MVRTEKPPERKEFTVTKACIYRCGYTVTRSSGSKSLAHIAASTDLTKHEIVCPKNPINRRH